MKNREKFDILIVGCGLSGMVVAREMAEQGRRVRILEKREHIGGNLYDYYDEHGILVQKYGPHVFFTNNEKIEEYVKRFVSIQPFYPEYRTYINGCAIPMPFNFSSIDILYEISEAKILKGKLIAEFGENSVISVVDVLKSQDAMIRAYGAFMYEHEYRKYTAKHWGKSIEEIDASVFTRVPVYVSYKKEYEQHEYQYLPVGGFTELSRRIVNHDNISVIFGIDALDYLFIDETAGVIKESLSGFNGSIIYTAPLDALFRYRYGVLPYRSLEFIWKTISSENAPTTPLTAFPEGDKYIRITDYTQFPPQELKGKSVIAIEIPLAYKPDELCGNEPYYPILTEESKKVFTQYETLAKSFKNLYPCGRLADFKYYNMDQAIERAWALCHEIGDYTE